MSNSLGPDQARHSVGPGMGANCLQRLSADDTSRQRCCEIQYGLKKVIRACIQHSNRSIENRIYKSSHEHDKKPEASSTMRALSSARCTDVRLYHYE